METLGSLFFIFMSVFDRFTKKATNNALGTVKETLNDKLETYSGIIKIGLTLGVIVFGTNKIMGDDSKQKHQQSYPQQPIIINNYFDRGYSNGRAPAVKHGKKH